MKAKLVRLESNHNNLRTNEVIGECKLPKIGKEFEMRAPALDPNGSFRWVQTTPVREIKLLDGDGTCTRYEFKTENSTYQLELL